MQPGCKLRVAGCAQFRPCSILWTGFYSKMQPATYIGLCFFYFVYILYNIIKNKKKEPTYRVAHIEKKKRMHTKGCGLRFS